MKKYDIDKAIIYHKTGIELIRARKLKEIISPSFSSKHVGEEIFICDKNKVYGIIVLNQPTTLTVDQFKNHSSRHLITQELKEDIWPDVNKFNAYTFRIKKIFEKERDFFYDRRDKLVMSEFIKDVEILEKGVIGYKDLGKAPIETSWDGPAERKKATTDTLRIISTWFDSQNPDVKSAYKLPHHKAEGHSAVFRGVAAAMGALLGARGGVDIPTSDRQGVYNHLKRHYGQFDREAPTLKAYEVEELKSLFPELYKDIIKYEVHLETLKGIECDKDKQILKTLLIELFELYLKRMLQKPDHAGGSRRCPSGMVRDRRTGRCVRRKSKEKVNV